jgi:hypothetical protein
LGSTVTDPGIVVAALILALAIVASAALVASAVLVAAWWWRGVGYSRWALAAEHLELDREAFEAGLVAVVPGEER